MSKFRECFSVGAFQVDHGNIITPENLVNLLQECANHQMRDRKPTYYQLLNEGKSLIVSRMKVDIHGAIYMYDNLDVATWKCPSKGMILYRGYEALYNNQVVAEAIGCWAVVDRHKGRICRPEAIDLSNYETDCLPIDGLEPFKKVGRRELNEFEYFGSYTVKSSDVDMNLHMNNARYFKVFWDVVQASWKGNDFPFVRTMDIKYGGEAMLGSCFDIYVKPGGRTWKIATIINDKMGAQCDVHIDQRSVWGLRHERKI